MRILYCVVVLIFGHAASCATVCQSQPVTLGQLPVVIDEASGIAFNAQQRLLYLHNDSGDSDNLYVTDTQLNRVMTVHLQHTLGIDFEDIALGPCTASASAQCVYIADTGDNRLIRNFVKIYRLPESAILQAWRQRLAQISLLPEVMYVQYPDGRYDSEAMIVDEQANLYLFTKQLGRFRIYQTQFKASRQYVALSYVSEVALHAGWLMENMVTAADYDTTSRTLLLRSYLMPLRYELQNYAMAQLSQLVPQRLPSVFQAQAESIAWMGAGYVTTSEGLHKPVYYFPCGE